MTLDQAISVGQLVATSFAGLAGLLLSFAVYRLSSRQREDAWQVHFAGIHDNFWKDEDFRIVRGWLACPISYAELEGILAKRRNAETAAKITPDEYTCLERLDKFLNLMTRVIALDTGSRSHKRLPETLFFAYWLQRAVGKTSDDIITHDDLYWYVQTFYPTITKHRETDLTTR